MNTYIGTKVVKARPMIKKDFCIYVGRDLPKDEDGKEKGYLVEYTDGGAANHPEHKGYISWSPVDVFTASYNIMENINSNKTPILKYFTFAHLPEHLQKISAPICSLAILMDTLPNCPEKTAGLRKLLEAKDCLVRASLEK